MNSATLKLNIRGALKDIANGDPLVQSAAKLLNVLGYDSPRKPKSQIFHVDDFLRIMHAFDDQNGPGKLSINQIELFKPWQNVQVIFQFTEDEIGKNSNGFADDVDNSRIESFLFIAVELENGNYSRTQLADSTRAVNRLFDTPVIILYRYIVALETEMVLANEPHLTIATTHRRTHMRDDNKDVLTKVSLVKDVRIGEPQRMHLDILSDLSLPKMLAKKKGCNDEVKSFDDLHAAWERVLDIDTLNQRFYQELFRWFDQCKMECQFPSDDAGDGCQQRHVIRLITRILFVWFIKEKGLLPKEVFEEDFAAEVLRNHNNDNSNYYLAVLQNLFFATLNSPISQRTFNRGREPLTHTNSTPFHYKDLLVSPDDYIMRFSGVPFVNGGLFDCLECDGFSETEGRKLHVPSKVFFDPNDGLFPLLNHHKFTIEENTPLDCEVALDPELLGRVFENLLAAYNPETETTARKSTGSFYTPRPVVEYMVRESLAEAIASRMPVGIKGENRWRDLLTTVLDHKRNFADIASTIAHETRRAIVRSIAELRILDPAVGSGAFPMGVLQVLTLALRRLDPQNVLWQELQRDKAQREASSAFNTENRYERDEALREISFIFEKYRTGDFGRKLYLIQNSIFGADIQPIACQIAKLRFFISLVIEQDPDSMAEDERGDNLGIRALPNLETRFVAADALVDHERLITKTDQPDDIGVTTTVKMLEEQLRCNRVRYFHESSRIRKLELQGEDKKLRDLLSLEMKRIGHSASRVQSIVEWDPFNQNRRADWFEPRYMFGVRKFDIVIGNPPYIQLQKNNGKLGKKYKKWNYETFAGRGDVYQLFFERGCQLLAKGSGVLAFITSNSWLKANYGSKTREWFTKNRSVLVVIEMGKDVFDNAIVDASILIVRDGRSESDVAICRAVDIEQTSDATFPPLDKEWGTLRPKCDSPWVILSPMGRSIMDKMSEAGTPLQNWSDISIYYGIKTGFNEAFIVDRETRDRLVQEDSSSEHLLRPVIRGRDIQRYRLNWANLFVIATLPPLGINIDDFPAVKNHLLTFGYDRLVQAGKPLAGGGKSRSKTSYAWFEVQNTCAYHAEFRKPKLFWMQMADYGRFALGDQSMVCNQKCFMVTGPDLGYLCAALNSSLVTWFVRHTAVTTGMGLHQWDKYTVGRVPIPLPNLRSSSWGEQVIGKVTRAIETKNNLVSHELQESINNFILNRYGLSSRERQYVETSAMYNIPVCP